MADFRQKNADKYQNKFASEPATRPAYIPSTYTVGGTHVNIVWNPLTSSYGYYNGATFMYYDPIPVVSHHAYVNYYDANGPPSGWSVLCTFVGLVSLLIFLGWIFTR